MNYVLSEVQEQHLSRLADILNHYVLHTTVTFHTQPLTNDDLKEKLFFSHSCYKSFVIQENEKIVGYCAVSQWEKQEAYRHTAEINIYLQHEYLGKGIGSMAVSYLEEFAKANGINTLIAGLCTENLASQRLFEKNGYSQCAMFRAVGKKFGRTLDTVYYQKLLN